MKNLIIGLVVLAVVGVGGYFLYQYISGFSGGATVNEGATPSTNEEPATTTPEDTTKTVIGTSAGGAAITAYHYYGTSTTTDTELLFVGGIHGGYEWNTALVAYELMDYLEKNPSSIPQNIKVTVIPVVNPDGLSKVVGTTSRFTPADVSTSEAVQISGRFNANTVDLNRNFDCDWQAEGTWKTTTVSGGTAAFSEPESKAVKAYIEAHMPTAVVVWYSAAGGVFASSCHNGVLAETKTLTQKYADASGYPAFQSFNFYEITGDMVNWLAKQKIPAISVLLTTHTSTEWEKNKKGIEALFKYYTK